MSSLSICETLKDVPAEQWNALAGDTNPFIQHEFLLAFETGQCLENYGWLPRYFLVHDEHNDLIGAMPAYEKHNSYGEFVFDWAWADAYQRAGLHYYPKLVIAIPYSPCQGPRLLAKNNEPEIKSLLIEFALEFARKQNYSSVHWLFTLDDDYQLLKQHSKLQRFDYQFHWHNHDYKNFDDFLAQLSSKKRKNIKQERRKVRDQQIEIKTFNGEQLSDEQWEKIYFFYKITFMKKSGAPTLSLNFFKAVAKQLLIIFAYHGEETVASAICIIGKDTLYGRHWGCLEEYDSLHFEVCYYTGIEYCIEHGLKTFEPGAQGEHKIARGFLPVKTRSAHWVANAQFSQLLEDHLQREAAALEGYGEELWQASPYKDSP
ncbi:MAG TPA: GNAT family N-acetyltransferase [Gammaproteobacteria bacterium]